LLCVLHAAIAQAEDGEAIDRAAAYVVALKVK